MLSCLASSSWCFKRALCLHLQGQPLRKVLPNQEQGVTSQKRPESSATVLWEPQISQYSYSETCKITCLPSLQFITVWNKKMPSTFLMSFTVNAGNITQHSKTRNNTGENNRQWRDWGSTGHIFTWFIHNLQYITCFLRVIKSVASWLPWLPGISHPCCHGEICTDDKVTVPTPRCIGTDSARTQLLLLLIPNIYGWKRAWPLWNTYCGWRNDALSDTVNTDGSNATAKIYTRFAVRIIKWL